MLAYFALSFLLSILAVSSSSTNESQQKQNVYEYTYSGKGVRYETQPMHYVDAKGNKITATQAGAKMDFCLDMQGKRQPNGTEYQRTNMHFFTDATTEMRK